MSENTGRIWLSLLLIVSVAWIGVVSAVGQTKKKKRKAPATTVKTVPAVTTSGDASVVSRADDLTDLIALPVDSQTNKTATSEPDPTTRSLEELRDRIKALESVKKSDPDAKQKRLSLSLDIVTRAEQRSDTLRKQLFEMIEKENTISGRLDAIENEMRPEVIDRQIATTGSLRPEELRALKRKSLELERTNLQALLVEVRRNRASIEQNLQKSDQLVERLRARLEKEIDAALTEEEGKPE